MNRAPSQYSDSPKVTTDDVSERPTKVTIHAELKLSTYAADLDSLRKGQWVSSFAKLLPYSSSILTVRGV